MRLRLTWEQNLNLILRESTHTYNSKRIFLEWIESYRFQSRINIDLITKLFLSSIKSFEWTPINYIRLVITRLFRFDPLANLPAADINLGIPILPKDLELLRVSILAAIEASKNEVKKIIITTPEIHISEIGESIEDFESSIGIPIEVISDEFLVSRLLNSNFEFISSVARMEFAKFALATYSDIPILIIDSDTILLRMRNWLTNKGQILICAQEYYLHHKRFSAEILNNPRLSGLGFVAHHGIFIPQIVAELFEACGGALNLANHINIGIKNGWRDTHSFPSEWQLYGDYLTSRNSGESITFAIAGFANLGCTRKILGSFSNSSISECKELIARIRSAVPELGSLSLHDYKS